MNIEGTTQSRFSALNHDEYIKEYKTRAFNSSAKKRFNVIFGALYEFLF